MQQPGTWGFRVHRAGPLRTPMQQPALTLRRVQELRQRVLTGFYDQPEVVRETVQRILLLGHVQLEHRDL